MLDRDQWNAQLLKLPSHHLLQTWDWGQMKETAGWEMTPRVWGVSSGEISAAALVLTRVLQYGPVHTRLKVVYVPRGPLLDWGNLTLVDEVLESLEHVSRHKGVIFIKIDPEVIIGTGNPEDGTAKEDPIGSVIMQRMHERGWFYSSDQVQFKNSILVSLEGSEEDWLARMKQKTRYNLRLAQRKGVTVRFGTLEDIPAMYRMYADTAHRDGFIIRQQDYYTAVWTRFHQNQMAKFIIAEVESRPVAGLVLFHFGDRAWYLYGMSTQHHRDAMPTYLLQWEAMRVARDAGCKVYDLWGAPDEFNEEDPLWGVYRFKLGWGGQVVRTLGAWDFTSKPSAYRLYSTVIPGILSLMRFFRRRETKREVSP